ncbi:MAG TPA: hypothetical protein VHG08_25640 [Longimicrobium sp.]|nr:hypothetical protein [Longimicrobium sp.]
MSRIIPAAVLLAALLSACGERGPTPEQLEARRNARLDACVAEALSINARSRLATLDSLLMQSQARGSVPALVSAPHKFAQVYATYADLRAHETAYRDSAYSATSKEDSTRYEQEAARYRVNRPSPESLEENVIRDYIRDFAVSRNNPDHGCYHLVRGEEVKEEGE